MFGGRDDDNENVFWPGLVDLFAFGMLLTMLLWLGASRAEKTDPDNTAERLEQCLQEVATLEEKVKLRDMRIGELTLETGGDDVVVAAERDKADVLLCVAEHRLGELRAELLGALREYRPRMTAVDKERSAFGLEAMGTSRGAEEKVERLLFGTGEFALQGEQRDRVATFVGEYATIVKSDRSRYGAAYLVLEGSADPRPYRGLPASPPRDNVELSALRAAAVAKVVKRVETERQVDVKLQVLGLGSQGDPQETDTFEQFRSVRLEVRMDLAGLDATDGEIRRCLRSRSAN